VDQRQFFAEKTVTFLEILRIYLSSRLPEAEYLLEAQKRKNEDVVVSATKKQKAGNPLPLNMSNTLGPNKVGEDSGTDPMEVPVKAKPGSAWALLVITFKIVVKKPVKVQDEGSDTDPMEVPTKPKTVAKKSARNLFTHL
jgi:hypothetical protein